MEENFQFSLCEGLLAATILLLVIALPHAEIGQRRSIIGWLLDWFIGIVHFNKAA